MVNAICILLLPYDDINEYRVMFTTHYVLIYRELRKLYQFESLCKFCSFTFELCHFIGSLHYTFGRIFVGIISLSVFEYLDPVV